MCVHCIRVRKKSLKKLEIFSTRHKQSLRCPKLDFFSLCILCVKKSAFFRFRFFHINSTRRVQKRALVEVGKSREAIFIHVRSYQTPCSQYHDEKVHIYGGMRWYVMQVFQHTKDSHTCGGLEIHSRRLFKIYQITKPKNKNELPRRK